MAAEASSRSRSAFLTQLSHELRTPLHSILGYSGLMRAEADTPEAQRRLDAIQRSGRHLLILIIDLPDFAQTLPPQMPRRHAGPARRLLVVDDKRENRELLTDLLQQQGFIVVASDSAGKALARLSREAFDLVLTDLRMPGMDGREFLLEARRRGVTQPFIVVSALTPELSPSPEGQADFAAWLVKPVNPERLASVLARTLGLARVQGPVVTGAPPARPSGRALEALRAAAGEGRISDIEDWVEQVKTQEPVALAFALQVRERVRRLDLAGILVMTR